MGKDVAESIQLAAGRNLTVDGSGYTITGAIVCKTTAQADTKLEVRNATLDGEVTSGFAVQSQDQTQQAGRCHLDLKLENCTVKNYTKKGVYLTNVDKLSLVDCVFDNCASDSMDDPNTVGDYVVDLNLVGVNDADIEIKNCKFSNNKAKKANIKIAARGGASDADASDMPKGVAESTVQNVSISGCTFENNDSNAVDFNIGTTSKTEGDVENTTGAYPVTISNNLTDMKAAQPYNEYEVTVPAGETFVKSKDGNLGKVIQVNSIEELKSAIADSAVSKIELTGPIVADGEMQIQRYIEIDGKNNIINTSEQNKVLTLMAGGYIKNLKLESTADNSEWSGAYGIHAYTNDVVLENVAAKGFNAAFNINGAVCDLKGTIDVSGNTFGGIEVSKGSSPKLTASILNIGEASLLNTTEVYGQPTIWVDGTTEDIGIVNGADDFTLAVIKEQNQYYLDAEHAVEA